MPCIVMFPGTSDTPQYGPGRHVFEISKRLGKKGFIILNVVPCYNRQISVQVVADSYFLLGVRVTDLRLVESTLRKIDSHLGLIPHYFNYKEAAKRFLSNLDEQIVLHTHAFGVIAQPTRESRLCKRVATIHGFGQMDTVARGKSRFRARLLHSLLKRVYQNADQYTTFSNTMKVMANHFYGLDPERVSIIPHGVDTDFFSHKPKGTEIEDLEVNFDLDRPNRVLFLGHLVKGKGLDILLEAFTILHQRRSDLMLLVKAGLERDSREIARESERLGIRDLVRVIYRKFSENELRALYKLSNVFVNLQLSTGYSTALLEAMACGVPPIIYKHSMNADVVDESCGVVLGTMKASDLADAIEMLLNDSKLARKLGSNAANRVREEYDWDRIVVPRYVSLYTKLET